MLWCLSWSVDGLFYKAYTICNQYNMSGWYVFGHTMASWRVGFTNTPWIIYIYETSSTK